MIYDKAYYEAQGYRFFSGHTFKYFENGVSWKEAKAACEALGGHLATSTSAEKNEFLTTLVIDNAWLGGTKVVTEDTWTWITGEEWSYTNWDDAHSGNASDEHYLELELSGKLSVGMSEIDVTAVLDSAKISYKNEYGKIYFMGTKENGTDDFQFSFTVSDGKISNLDVLYLGSR